jgi:threonine synthase
MTLSAWFACADDCAGGRDARYPLTDVRYACPACGGLLEVRHDLAALRAHGDAAAWRRRFADRWGDAVVGGPDARAGAGSGVWGKREWVHPGLPDRAIVSLGEGGSHLVRADRYAAALGLGEVYVKQCGTSHSGSFKDLGMTVLVSTVNDLIQRGAPIRAVACASTGDTSAALAAYGAAAGIRTIVILPRGKISTAQLVQPLANGALVLALDTDFDGCMQIVQQLATRDGVYLANSMNSLRVEGQKTVAIELTQQLGWRAPDWVIIPGGNLGNVSALGAGFAMMKDLGLIDRLPRICVAQTAGAAPLVTSYAAGWAPLVPVRAKATLASAIQIGAPVSFGKAVRALRACDGVALAASEVELADAAARADRAGLFTCPHTGVALAALEQLAARGQVTRDHRVVVVSTASGLKFADFKVGYHDGALADVPAPRHANRPIDLPADYAAVREVALRALDAAPAAPVQ